MSMIDVVVHVGVVRILRTIRHEGLSAGWNRKELKTDVISLCARFRDRPNRVFHERRVAFDRLVQITLKLRDCHPRSLTTPAFLALIGDAPVARLVVALER